MPLEKAGRLGRARVPPSHVFKTKAGPTRALETVDDPDADTTCLRRGPESDMRNRLSHDAGPEPPRSFPCPFPTYAITLLPRRSSPPRCGRRWPRSLPSRSSTTTTIPLLRTWLGRPRRCCRLHPNRKIDRDQLKRASASTWNVATAPTTRPRETYSGASPSRRNTSSTGLDTLAEADTPLDGEERRPTKDLAATRGHAEIGQPDSAAAWTSRRLPVARYSPRRDAVRRKGSKH